MENSGKILFQDKAASWYIALESRWIGPLSAADVYEKIQRQEITWAHYAWKRGQSDWKRICDIRAFTVAVPHHPGKSLKKQLGKETQSSLSKKNPAKQESVEFHESIESGDLKIWYLHYHDSQYGPFSSEEIRQFLKSGKIHAGVHAWRQGMKNWQRLQSLAEFKAKAEPPRRVEVARKVPGLAEDGIELRLNPRRPLVAKILMADEQSVIVGVCRDISIGGLQVLTERIPGNAGSKLKMNISPASNDAGNRIEAFTAEGEIVRILEDGRGFSFRFHRLSDRAKQAIESYIKSPG